MELNNIEIGFKKEPLTFICCIALFGLACSVVVFAFLGTLCLSKRFTPNQKTLDQIEAIHAQ